jgi:hypothetical protein
MSEPAENVSTTERNSESSVRAAPNSAEASSSYLPPPPAQLVAALAEFETSGPGPESFRRSVPDFSPPDAPIGAPDTQSKPSPARVETQETVTKTAAAPAPNFKLPGIVAGVALVIVALLALLSR